MRRRLFCGGLFFIAVFFLSSFLANPALAVAATADITPTSATTTQGVGITFSGTIYTAWGASFYMTAQVQGSADSTAGLFCTSSSPNVLNRSYSCFWDANVSSNTYTIKLRASSRTGPVLKDWQGNDVTATVVVGATPTSTGVPPTPTATTSPGTASFSNPSPPWSAVTTGDSFSATATVNNSASGTLYKLGFSLPGESTTVPAHNMQDIAYGNSSTISTAFTYGPIAQAETHYLFIYFGNLTTPTVLASSPLTVNAAPTPTGTLAPTATPTPTPAYTLALSKTKSTLLNDGSDSVDFTATLTCTGIGCNVDRSMKLDYDLTNGANAALNCTPVPIGTSTAAVIGGVYTWTCKTTATPGQASVKASVPVLGLYSGLQQVLVAYPPTPTLGGAGCSCSIAPASATVLSGNTYTFSQTSSCTGPNPTPTFTWTNPFSGYYATNPNPQGAAGSATYAAGCTVGGTGGTGDIIGSVSSLGGGAGTCKTTVTVPAPTPINSGNPPVCGTGPLILDNVVNPDGSGWTQFYVSGITNVPACTTIAIRNAGGAIICYKTYDPYSKDYTCTNYWPKGTTNEQRGLGYLCLWRQTPDGVVGCCQGSPPTPTIPGVPSSTPTPTEIITPSMPTRTPTPTSPPVTPTPFGICDNSQCIATSSASGPLPVFCDYTDPLGWQACVPHGGGLGPGQCTGITPTPIKVSPNGTVTVVGTAIGSQTNWNFGWGSRQWVNNTTESTLAVDYSDTATCCSNPGTCSAANHCLAPTTWDWGFVGINDAYCTLGGCFWRFAPVADFRPTSAGVVDRVQVFMRKYTRDAFNNYVLYPDYDKPFYMAIFDSSDNFLGETRGAIDGTNNCTNLGCWIDAKFAEKITLGLGTYYLKIRSDDWYGGSPAWGANEDWSTLKEWYYFRIYMRQDDGSVQHGTFCGDPNCNTPASSCSGGQAQCVVYWKPPSAASPGDKYTIGADIYTLGMDVSRYGKLTNTGMDGLGGNFPPQACFGTVTVDYGSWLSTNGGGDVHANSDISEAIPATATNPPGAYLTANGSPGGVVSTTKTLSLGAGAAGAGSKNWRVTSYGNGSFNIDGMELNSTGRFYDTVLENLSGKLPAGYSVTGPVNWSGDFTNEIQKTSGGSQIGAVVGNGIVWNINGDLNITNNGKYNGSSKIVVMVSGKITIDRDGVQVKQDDGAIVFVSRGGVEIQSASTGNPPTVDGVFLTDGTFTTDHASSGDDKQLTGKGMWMVSRSGSFDFNRDLGSTLNKTTPAEYLTFDAKYLILMQGVLGQSSYSWIEVAPEESNLPTPGPSATPVPTATAMPTIPLPTATPTSSPTPTPTQAPQWATFTIASTSDDAYETWDGLVVTDSQNAGNRDGMIHFGWYEAAEGLRFTGTSALKGKQILQAYVTVMSSGTTANDVKQNIYLQKTTGNCGTFTTGYQNITTRPITTSSSYWNLNGQGWNNTQYYNTVDFSSALSEVVNNASWTGTDLCVILKNAGAGNWLDRLFWAKEGSGVPASLSVQYRTPVTPTATPTPTPTPCIPVDTPSLTCGTTCGLLSCTSGQRCHTYSGCGTPTYGCFDDATCLLPTATPTPSPRPTATPTVTPTVLPTSTPTVTPTPTPATAEFYVNANTDDAYENWNPTAYTTGNDSGWGWYNNVNGYRVTNGGLSTGTLSALKGKTIINAYLKISSGGNDNRTITQNIYLQAADTCATFSTAYKNLSNRPLTSSYATWSLNSTTPWSINARYTSPDIATVVSQVTSRAGWDGNSLCILVKEAGSPQWTERLVRQRDLGTNSLAASLWVRYR